MARPHHTWTCRKKSMAVDMKIMTGNRASNKKSDTNAVTMTIVSPRWGRHQYGDDVMTPMVNNMRRGTAQIQAKGMSGACSSCISATATAVMLRSPLLPSLPSLLYWSAKAWKLYRKLWDANTRRDSCSNDSLETNCTVTRVPHTSQQAQVHHHVCWTASARRGWMEMLYVGGGRGEGR